MIDLQELPPGKWADDTGDLFDGASAGDHPAQSAMAEHVLAMAQRGLVPVWEGLLVAEMYARMAATSGEVEDLTRVATVLMARHNVGDAGPIGDAGPNVKLTLEVEIITILDQIADEGDDRSVQLLESAAKIFSPEAFTYARQIRSAVLEEGE